MSQQETVVEIARIPAEGLSKKAAVAQMSIDFPNSTLRGIQPEPVDGHWVGLLQKNASQESSINMEIVRIPAKGLSKKTAAAKMSIDFPDSNLRGIQPEPVDGYWVGIMEKKATEEGTPSDFNAVANFDHDSGTVEPLTPQDEPEENEFDEETDEDIDMDQDMYAEEDEDRDQETMKLLHEVLDRLAELEDKLSSGTGGVSGFRGGEWGGTEEGPVDDTAFLDEQKELDPFGETDYDEPEDMPFGKKSNAIKVNRERIQGMSVRQARVELIKEANNHPKLRNYQIADIDVSSDGKKFEATLVPKQQRRRRNR